MIEVQQIKRDEALLSPLHVAAAAGSGRWRACACPRMRSRARCCSCFRCFHDDHFAFVADAKCFHSLHHRLVALVSAVDKQTRNVATEIEQTVNLTGTAIDQTAHEVPTCRTDRSHASARSRFSPALLCTSKLRLTAHACRTTIGARRLREHRADNLSMQRACLPSTLSRQWLRVAAQSALDRRTQRARDRGSRLTDRKRHQHETSVASAEALLPERVVHSN